MTRRMWFVFATALLGGSLAAGWQSATATPLPPFITSDWEVTCLLPDGGGVWVGTTGGIIRVEQDGTQQRFTRADGLPAHEVRQLEKTPGGIRAVFATGTAEWNGARWMVAPTLTPAPPSRPLAVPPGAMGTHISAKATTGTGETLVGVWGDQNLYRRSTGMAWRAEPSGLPPGVGTQVTALAEQNQHLWAGTRRAGLWRRDGGTWQQVTTGGSTPVSHNAQAVTRYGGRLWISTLDDGLMAHDGKRWAALAPTALSSNAPRQMVVFQNRLYVRHGTGAIDCWDGKFWAKDVFRTVLPRRQASALSVGGGRLVVGVWGGFSVWDGGTWAHHLGNSQLAGIPIASLLASADGKTVWLGTQGRGLCEADILTGTVRRFYDERQGLPDDWVTEIAEGVEGGLYVGTFVGGLALRVPGASRFTVARETIGENVTGIVPGPGYCWVATRHGVRRTSLGGTAMPPYPLQSLVMGAEVEAQCLFADGSDLWVGTRTGVYRVPMISRD